MSEFKTQTDAAVEILNNARIAIIGTVTNPELAPLKNKLVLGLEQQINAIAIMNGGQTVAPVKSITGQPLRKILGRDVSPKASSQIPPAPTVPAPASPEESELINKTARQVQADELKSQAGALLEALPTMENDAILDSFSELEIRAVGKLVGLPVTETSPKNVDVKFLDQIRAAVKKKKDIEEGGQVNAQEPASSQIPPAPTVPAPAITGSSEVVTTTDGISAPPNINTDTPKESNTKAEQPKSENPKSGNKR